jgi:HAD superfamily hydrolase (TIGR01509 family)
MIRGVIFDFNGTLFWDTDLHNQTWDRYLTRYGIRLSDTEKHLHLHGKNNRQIVEELFGKDVSDVEVERISREKELLYQEAAIESGLQLADGAVELIEFLIAHHIPISIVTASDKLNVDFFIDYLQLGQWFDEDKIIFNNGTMKGKPDPEMFLLAMSRMGCSPGETAIFEDSENGIKAADRARPGKLYIVNSAGND